MTVRSVRGLALSCHPVPSLAVTALTAGLCRIGGTSVGRGALATSAVFLGQLSIGWCNDTVDADRDRRVLRTDKPVATGLVSRRQTGFAAITAWIASIVVSAPLGWRAFSVVLAGVAAGWAYDVWFKWTVFSWAPYAMAFASLPAVATFTAADARWPAAWVMVTGALLGVAAHFANVLPDLQDDALTRVRGLPQRIGGGRSAMLGAVALTAASGLILIVSSGLNAVTRSLGLTVSAILGAWAMHAGLVSPGNRRYFFAVIGVAALDLLFFAVSGEALA